MPGSYFAGTGSGMHALEGLELPEFRLNSFCVSSATCRCEVPFLTVWNGQRGFPEVRKPEIRLPRSEIPTPHDPRTRHQRELRTWVPPRPGDLFCRHLGRLIPEFSTIDRLQWDRRTRGPAFWDQPLAWSSGFVACGFVAQAPKGLQYVFHVFFLQESRLVGPPAYPST